MQLTLAADQMPRGSMIITSIPPAAGQLCFSLYANIIFAFEYWQPIHLHKRGRKLFQLWNRSHSLVL